jgi:RNA polymerase sigma-70 factor (ECF subfamily)
MSEFHRLVEQQIPRLRRYARALTHNRERADDLVQDSLARALVKEDLWQPGTNLRAWLFTIMHNQHVNIVRRDSRESAGIDIEHVSATLSATTDPSASRQMLELERALAQLPSERREVILLVGLEGMSYEESAEILGVPIGTVRSRLSRGRDTLRKLLGMEDRGSQAATPQAA